MFRFQRFHLMNTFRGSDGSDGKASGSRGRSDISTTWDKLIGADIIVSSQWAGVAVGVVRDAGQRWRLIHRRRRRILGVQIASTRVSEQLAVARAEGASAKFLRASAPAVLKRI